MEDAEAAVEPAEIEQAINNVTEATNPTDCRGAFLWGGGYGIHVRATPSSGCRNRRSSCGEARDRSSASLHCRGCDRKPIESSGAGKGRPFACADQDGDAETRHELERIEVIERVHR